MKRRKKGKSLNKLKAIFLIVFIATAFKLNADTPKAEATTTPTIIEYHVSKGQTLWGIAKNFRKEHEDIRQVIYEIEQLNELENATIYEGQTLKIKIEE